MELFLSSSNDVFTNLALESSLLSDSADAAFLWVNDPCVVVGRNQNPYRETDVDYLATHGIALARRTSGGGAVYHDSGNLNYSFVSCEPCESFAKDVASGCLSQLGVSSEWRGRNDLVVDGAKVGGMAQVLGKRHLCHGTLMVSVDLDQLDRALRPSALKLAGHSIESARSRVRNLCDVNAAVSTQALVASFENVLGTSAKELAVTARVRDDARAFAGASWVYGESPRFDVSLERRLPDGLYQFDIQVEDGSIGALEIYTDSCETPDLEAMRAWLIGKEFTPQGFGELLLRCPAIRH